MRWLSTIVTGKTFLFATCNVFWTTKEWKLFLRIIHFFVSLPSTGEVSHMGFAILGKTYIFEGNQRTELWNTNHRIKKISLIGLNWQISIIPELIRMVLRLWNTTQSNHRRTKPTLRMCNVTFSLKSRSCDTITVDRWEILYTIYHVLLIPMEATTIEPLGINKRDEL